MVIDVLVSIESDHQAVKMPHNIVWLLACAVA